MQGAWGYKMIRPIKRFICWIIGHKHQVAGDYSMCWRCGQIKKIK